MAQLKERGYADKYRHLGEPIHVEEVEFSAEKRNVARFETEVASLSSLRETFDRRHAGTRRSLSASKVGQPVSFPVAPP